MTKGSISVAKGCLPPCLLIKIQRQKVSHLIKFSGRIVTNCHRNIFMTKFSAKLTSNCHWISVTKQWLEVTKFGSIDRRLIFVIKFRWKIVNTYFWKKKKVHTWHASMWTVAYQPRRTCDAMAPVSPRVSQYTHVACWDCGLPSDGGAARGHGWRGGGIVLRGWATRH